MKKYYFLIIVALILGLVLTGCSLLSNIGQAPANDQSEVSGLTKGEFDVECPAAPAVAGLLLEAAGVDNRYGTGKDGGNFIKDVAIFMGPETDFNGVSKCNIIAYECEVAAYLNGLDNPAGVTSQYEGVPDPEASGAEFVDNADRTGTMYLTVLDKCGKVIEGLVLADIEVDIGSVGLTDLFTLGAGGYWDIVLTGMGNGVYEIVFFRLGSVPYTRNWDVIVKGEVIEEGLYVAVTNPVTVYTLNITSVNNYTGYTHFFTINYYFGTDTGTGTGSNGQVVSDIVFDVGINQLSFKSVYTNGYTWYPAFVLESDGTLTYVNLGGDNVYAATGTWIEI